MIDFPALCPTRRRLQAGQYPVKQFDSISGASVTRLYGSKAFNAQLVLGYSLNDDEMALMMESYHKSMGGAVSLKMPETVYAGMGQELRVQVQNYYSWRWSSPPVIESLLPGRSRIEVTLIGTLEA